MLEGVNQWVAVVGGVVATFGTFVTWALLVRSPMKVTLTTPLDGNFNALQGVKILNRSTAPLKIDKAVFVVDGWLRLPILVGCTEDAPYGGVPLEDYKLEPRDDVLGIVDDRYDEELFEMVQELPNPRGIKTGRAEVRHTLRNRPVRSKIKKMAYFNLWFEAPKSKSRKRR